MTADIAGTARDQNRTCEEFGCRHLKHLES
jgi:hypothetical protein